MNITRLSVKNFRNLATQEVTLGQRLNVFVGNNAQGKTNLLESVYLCCLGKSPRTDRDKDMINWQEDRANVSVDFACRAGNKQIGMELSKDKKTPSLNGLSFNRIGELLGHLNCVYFSPEEIKVVTLSPAERRRFLDIDLCQLDKTYYSSLSRFNRILAQRNNLLKRAGSVEAIADMLIAWDAQLAREGARIIVKRREFCNALAVYADITHLYLTKTEKLTLEYVTNIGGETQSEIEQAYIKKLSDSLERDFMQRFTSNGCQRDDIKFSVDGVDIRNFGSQGQQRTTALSLKLAELELFNKLTGEYPILLLDDVLSELDRSRQKALLSYSDGAQIILTATKVEKLLIKNLDYKVFKITSGVAREQ